jgi:hypothetical protein
MRKMFPPPQAGQQITPTRPLSNLAARKTSCMIGTSPVGACLNHGITKSGTSQSAYRGKGSHTCTMRTHDTCSSGTAHPTWLSGHSGSRSLSMMHPRTRAT